MNRKMIFTLRAWPVIAVATIGLCYLTQLVAGWFGITLPDQQNIDIVRQRMGWNWRFFSICLNVIVIMPVLEELYFRYFIYRRAQDPLTKRGLLSALIPTAVILATGAALAQDPGVRAKTLSECPHNTWLCYWIAFGDIAAAEYVFRVFLCRLVAKTSVWSIAIFSAILFSAAHYRYQPFPDAAFIALAFFGLAQCWLYRRTNRLWCPMLNHALFNLTNLGLLFFLIFFSREQGV